MEMSEVKAILLLRDGRGFFHHDPVHRGSGWFIHYFGRRKEEVRWNTHSLVEQPSRFQRSAMAPGSLVANGVMLSVSSGTQEKQLRAKRLNWASPFSTQHKP